MCYTPECKKLERYSSKITTEFLLQLTYYISWQAHMCVQWNNELNNRDGEIHDKAII